MYLRSLQQLLAIRQHGSFARAARAMGLSQPSLSKNIARLEDELKGQIFVRGARGAELTPFGALVAEQAARVVQEADKLEQAAQLAAGGPSSLLRIGCGPELKRAFAPRLLAAVLEARPHLNIRLEVSDRLRLLPALRARELDVIFCIADKAVVTDSEVVAPFLTSFGVAVAAPCHPLASVRGITPEQFLQHPNAGPRNAHYTVQARFGPKAAACAAARYELSDFEPFMPLVLAGQATIRLPAFEAEPYVANGTLVQLDLPLDGALPYAGVTTTAASTWPIVRDVLRMARSVGAELETAQARLSHRAAEPPGPG